MGKYWLTRFCFQRALAFIYFIGFLMLVNQSQALIGSGGLLPAKLFVDRISFWQSPSIFYLNISDPMLITFAWLGLSLSIVALIGISESCGAVISGIIWFLLWIIYLSFVNIGQTFYGFGWEILLLETGFLAIFLGAKNLKPQLVMIWLLRWVLFRLMLGAGLIKIRGDGCWRDFTCMYFHYETQPLPNFLSLYFHNLPQFIHKTAVLFTHFIELIVPFGFFGPRYVRYVAGTLTIAFQLMLIASGNLSWLNYITIVLCIACFDDAFLSKIISLETSKKLKIFKIHNYLVWMLALVVGFLSWRPTLNLIMPGQLMNSSFDPLHLVNTYGAFGSITRVRNEIILEGSRDGQIWKEYGFRGKPGDVNRQPPQVSPYHFKLDWQMWFAAMTDYRYHPWILNLVAKLLQNDRDVLGLMANNPFKGEPPKYIRALLYEYHFSDHPGVWWQRQLRGEYLPPLSLDDPQFRKILALQGWL